MGSTVDKTAFRHQLERLEDLIQEVEGFADPAAQAHAKEMIQALLEFHGTGLARILELLARVGEPGRSILSTLARDDLVGSLLLLHGLHRLDLETRVRQALEKVGPALRAHGGHVELLSVAEDAVRRGLHGSCEGCPSSAETLKLTLEEAVSEAAPEVTVIEVEEAMEHSHSARVALRVLPR